MDLKVEGNPGQGNHYEETTVQTPEVYAPNATSVTIVKANGKSAARIAGGLAQLHKEIGKEVSEETKEAVRHYETKIPGTKDVEEKLTDGGFSVSRIKEAVRLKEFWSKEAFRTSDYPVIQEENFQLYSRIVHEFNIYIMPMVEDELPLRDIMKELHEKIVSPIMTIYQENGYNDENLRYTYDHIYGIIYYLTGKCHLNWKDYDNL